MDTQTSTTKTHHTLNGHEPVEKFVIQNYNNTKDILILVPGTTDPVNFHENPDNDATLDYWHLDYLDKKTEIQFIEGIRQFAAKYPLKQMVEVFSWTGDNETKSRQNAARDLLAMIKRITWTERTTPGKYVNLHFISHSHGGNVIHEFTKFAVQDPEFPDTIKIRSLVYLSTPFFTRQAQINLDILHPDCSIINVYNKYDLTQRYVANFSMHQMPGLLSKFENDAELKSAFYAVMNAPYVSMLVSKAAEGIFFNVNPLMPLMQHPIDALTSKQYWTQILSVFKNLDKIITRIQSNLSDTYREKPGFITDKILTNLNGVLNGISDSLLMAITNLTHCQQTNRSFNITELINAIGPGVADFVDKLNIFLRFHGNDALNSSGLRSNLSDVIGDILLKQIDTFDITSNDIDRQLEGKFTAKPVDVTTHDPYNDTPESDNYAAFIARMIALEHQYDAADQHGPEGANIRAEMVFTMAAQEDYGIFRLIDTLLKWMDVLTQGQSKALINKTRSTIDIYARELKKRDYKILHHPPPDDNIHVYRFIPFNDEIDTVLNKTYDSYAHTYEQYTSVPFGSALGGIPYLAVKSHSVSRRTFLSEIAFRWESAMPDKTYSGLVYLKIKKN